MNALTTTRDESQVFRVMRDSLYPGAKPESVAMVLEYCTARGLDPLKKPVHIVPVWMDGEMRDVVMPGINSYRIDAARTGEYDGKSEPEFGPDVTRTFAGKVKQRGNWENVEKTVTYPAWCKVTVMRRGKPFVAKEFWTENYATIGKSEVPNEMWAKRPYGQIAKCAEAQALRMAFPEETGGAPTAEEMEGKQMAPDMPPARGQTIDAERAIPDGLPAPRQPAQPGSMRAEAEAMETRAVLDPEDMTLKNVPARAWRRAVTRALEKCHDLDTLNGWWVGMAVTIADDDEKHGVEMLVQERRAALVDAPA